MLDLIFDFITGKLLMTSSSGLAIDEEGKLLGKISDNLAMDLETGEIHVTTDW